MIHLRLSSILTHSRLAPIVLAFVVSAATADASRQEIGQQESPTDPHSASVKGLLSGVDGRPLDSIELKLHVRGFSRNITRGLRFLESERSVKLAHPLKTDGDGRFTLSHPLDPGRDYYLRWSGDGVEPGTSGWLTPLELESELQLTAVARRPFFGRLLDRNGQPIAEAEVRTRDREKTTTTNDRGEFRLAFVSELREPLVVRHPDGRLDWVLAGGGESWTDVVTGQESPASVALPASSVLRDLAVDLRERSLEVAIRNRHYIEFRWRLLNLAEVDLEGALQRLEIPAIIEWFERVTPAHFNDQSTCGIGTCYDSMVKEGVDLREYVGAQLRFAADSSDEQARSNYEALVTGPSTSLLLRSRLGIGLFAGVRLANATGEDETPTERTRRLVAEAPSLALYHQVRTYSHAASNLLQWGHDEEAAAVMAKARAIVAPGETPNFLSDDYIRALCRFDLDAGLELIRAKTKERYKGLMAQAVRLAVESPDLAIPLLHEAEALPVPRYGSSRSKLWLQKFVYALCETDLATADGLARRYDSTGYSLGLVALFLSREAQPPGGKGISDKVRRLLRAAYKTAQAETSPSRRSACAASLLGIACEANPSDFQHWLSLTLWMSSPDSKSSTTDPLLASLLREHQPALAKSLVFSTLRRAACDSFGLDSAWGVAAQLDPRRAAKAAIRESGRGLEDTAKALLHKRLGPSHGSRTAPGFWWPRE